MRRLSSITLATALAASPLLAQHDHGKPGEKLGAVSFPISCAPAVQQRFDRAMAMLHSGALGARAAFLIGHVGSRSPTASH